MKRVLPVLVFSICALLSSVASIARDIVVDTGSPSANDANSGTDSAPLKTLKAGLALAMPGDTVIVKPGRYSDPTATWYSAFTPTRSGTAAAPIVIKSVPALGAVLVPADYSPTRHSQLPAMSIYQKQYIVVDGFRADGQIKIMNDVVPIGAQFVTVQNCDIYYGSQEGGDNSLNWGLAILNSNNNVLRNNIVRDMKSSGNDSSNTAAIMLFASSNNIVENNDADAGNGVVYSAFGQKAGNIHDNIWRNNIARNAKVGFLGKGGTSGASYSDNETFYGNIIVNAEVAFNLNHNSRFWKVYNNTAYNTQYFMNQWQLNSVDNQFWNNLVVNSPGGMYQIEDLTSSSFSSYITYSNHNFFSRVGANFARWSYGSGNFSLQEWRTATGQDSASVSGDPLFVDAAGGNFRLQGTSPAKGRGRNGEDIGAYATGRESIGPIRASGPTPSAPVLTVR